MNDEDAIKCLLVDDTEDNLIALEALLRRDGLEILTARSGSEALELLLKHDVALALLDVQMPEMDGYEVASYTRANPATQDVPIIFVTATHETEATLLRGYGTGAVDFLFKPIDPYILRSKVQVFLDLYVGRRALAQEVEIRTRIQADLELANQALQHFTYAASHDLRAPLRAVSGMLEALDEEVGAGLEPNARQFLDRARKAGDRMRSLLDSLLVYAKLQRPVSLSAVDCAALVRQVQGDLAEPLSHAMGTLHIGELPAVRGDHDRLYQLFLNLVGNAIKFRRKDHPPTIEVTAEDKGAEIAFCVKDDGIGVASSKRAYVFEAFHRLNSPSVYEGSGLGLAICQQVVQQHGGKIWLESEEGRGSRFCFTLPKA